MSTSAFASALFPLPIDVVWKELRDFLFPSRLLGSVIETVELQEGHNGTDIGAIREIVWKTGEMRKHRLLGLSDQFHYISWELVESDPPVETSAIISRLKCYRVSETNHTVVEWSAEYGSDAPSTFVLFEQKSYQENLIEMRSKMTGNELPVLHHMNEAPSSRVLWLAAELGIPLRVKEVIPAPTDLRKSRETETPMAKGGMVACYQEGDLTILESGAILIYLLEKHDAAGKLSPKIGTRERALFHKFFFYAASTADHLLFHAYKLMYVLDEGEYGEETLNTLKTQWDEDVAVRFSEQLSKHRYICGDNFTAADIMLGWTLYIANLISWLDDHPTLRDYFNHISQRSAFRNVFQSFR